MWLHNRYIRRKRHVHGIRLFVVLLMIASGILVFLLHGTRPYQPSPQVKALIAVNANQYHLEPELLQAVIETESKYNVNAVSHVGAVGTMQLVPETAKWISEESGIPYGDLKNPEINIPLGSWYLNYLIGKYDGNLTLALAAYNAGRGNVDDWIKTNNWPANFSDADKIPFPETREFVKSVIRIEAELKAENGKS